MKILIDSNIPKGKELFSPYGETATFEGRHLQAHQLKGADALIIRSVTKINGALLKGASLKFVGSCTIGTDHVDLAFLKKNNIHFAYAPGCNCNAVGDYIISNLLLLHKKYSLQWSNLTLGIIGYGNVGKNLAAKARSMGINVLAHDPPLYDSNRHRSALSSLAEILVKADILSFHVPLITEGKYKTRGMFDQGFLKSLAKPIILFNSSRGEVMDEKTLISGKQSGGLKALVLDVFPEEPNISPELANACDIITPHIAGYSTEGKMQGSLDVLNKFISFFKLPPRKKELWMTPSRQIIDWNELDHTQTLRDIFERVYPFETLDHNLRRALRSVDPLKGFDLLRKTLTERQDFSSFDILGVPERKEPIIEKLKGLGFGVKSISQTEAIT